MMNPSAGTCLKRYEDVKNSARKALGETRPEDCLAYLRAASAYASMNHFGVWRDDEVEDMICRAAGMLPPPDFSPRGERADVLFMASFLSEVGGHSEALGLWASCLLNRRLHVLIADTSYEKTGPGAAKALESMGAKVKKAAHNAPCTEKIRFLAGEILSLRPEVTVLFINPDDVVSVAALALSKKSSGTKVFFFNHSDFTFWIGKSLMDTLVEFRTLGARASKALRKHAGLTAMSPLGTLIHQNTAPHKEDFMKPAGLTMSVSLGSAWKTVGDGAWDYFKTLGRILKENSNHMHVFLTSPEGDKFVGGSIRRLPPDVRGRFKVVYNVGDARAYYESADFLIETFPVSGGTVRLEAMGYGLPAIFIKNARCPLYSETDSLPPGYPLVASGNEEVFLFSSDLIRETGLRENYGRILREFYEERLSPEAACPKIRGILDGKENAEVPPPEEKKEQCPEDYLFMLDRLRGNPKTPYQIILGEVLGRRNHLSAKETLTLFIKLLMADPEFTIKKALSLSASLISGRRR